MTRTAGHTSDRSVKRQLRRVATWTVSRLRPIAPPGAWSAVVAARSLVGDGPLVLRPAVGRVLVVAPHPDDETIGCGGTLAGLAARGAQIDVLVATDGEGSVAVTELSATRTAAQRRSEATAACAALGVTAPTFAGLPDGALSDHIDTLTARIAGMAGDAPPDVVFVPWPLDGHVDHRAAAVALAAVDLPATVEIWTYEVWSPLPANRIVDITAHSQAKERALACHETAHGTVDASAHLALTRWRSLFGLDGHGHAEAFLVLAPVTLRQLVDRVLSDDCVSTERIS